MKAKQQHSISVSIISRERKRQNQQQQKKHWLYSKVESNCHFPVCFIAKKIFMPKKP